jgi:hypothetical protein
MSFPNANHSAMGLVSQVIIQSINLQFIIQCYGKARSTNSQRLADVILIHLQH